MENNWIKIFESSNPIEAKIVCDMLNANDIIAVELNKRDSSYTFFGRSEVYCRPEDVISAKSLINQMHTDNGF